MFKVDLTGFKQLMLGRPKWHFIRELISNSLDESSVGKVVVELVKTPRFCNIKVQDDGDGFERLSDAYTLFAPTKKRSDVKVRGRFNLGEKELASISKKMVIETTSGKVVFQNGKLSKHPKTKTDTGTIVSATIPMNKKDYELAKVMISWMIIPKSKKMTYIFDGLRNYVDWAVQDCIPIATTKETLKTMLFCSESGSFRPTQRRTRIDIYDLHENQNSGWLFELGIPVQEIDCEYNIDVQQKIPMNVNRDSVLDSYLRDIYAILLNNVHSKLDQTNVSESWVISASQDERTTDEAFKSIKDKKYGEKSVMWSSDLQANEDAIAEGFSVIHGKTMSGVERERMKGVGMVSSAVKFNRGIAETEYISKHNWTNSMIEYNEIIKRICKICNIPNVSVEYVKSPTSSVFADYNRESKSMRVNVSHTIGNMDFDPMSVKMLATALHELSHKTSGIEYAHDSGFWKELETLGGIILKQLLEIRQEWKL